jgi:hypothetical protein
MTPMDAFVARQNVKRLRRMLESELPAVARTEVERQLQDELAKLRTGGAAETQLGE